MDGIYYKEWSAVLDRAMEFKRYGHSGVPVLALPARGGRFYDWENNGMPEAAARLLHEGKMQLFCADSIDAESLLAGQETPRRRAEMQEKYFLYLTTELAPRVLALTADEPKAEADEKAAKAASTPVLWCAGVDTGAYQAVNCRLRRPELYEQWCETHPITELPKWKRGENVRLVRTEEQYQAAAKLFCEGRRTICAGNWTAEYCAGLREEAFLAQLKAEKKEGWACYLHTTKDVPDGMVSVDHKTGRIEHLFVAADARGKGIGTKLLDFARKKLEEHEHPTLTVLDQNTRAIALYRRMGWKLTGEAARIFDPTEDGFVQRRCELLVMRWEG